MVSLNAEEPEIETSGSSAGVEGCGAKAVCWTGDVRVVIGRLVARVIGSGWYVVVVKVVGRVGGNVSGCVDGIFGRFVGRISGCMVGMLFVMLLERVCGRVVDCKVG